MMNFFRKYQRIFIIILTAVIIITFSFFGTYNAFVSNEVRDEVAFQTVGGRDVLHSELSAMTRFISTDAYDKMLFGGVWGPNFLNDGIVKNDFFETGIVNVVASSYLTELKNDLEPRLEKQKRFSPYAHPQMPFLSARTVWGYFAPEINTHLEALKKANGQLDLDAFNAQVQLFLEERRFPSPYLKEVLKQQQSQLSWITPDPTLADRDLSLFGYHTLEEWFGPKTIQLIATVIINGAEVAEEKGYQVSHEEALADLLFQSEKSYNDLQRRPNTYLGVKNGAEYFREQLRLLSMDQGTAVDVWRKALLFRRLVNGVGDSVFVDPLVYQEFINFAGEKAQIELYQLPPSLHLKSGEELELFETYLSAVSTQKDSFTLPFAYKNVEEIRVNTPELVQKRYLLTISEVDTNAVGLRIPLREVWDWQLKGENWNILVNKFSELQPKTEVSERLAQLEQLDTRTRKAVDEYTRSSIVRQHPEWIKEALDKSPVQKKNVGISPNQKEIYIKGVQDLPAFQALLDQATAVHQESTNAEVLRDAQQANEALAFWSGDEFTYYKIAVLDRSPSWEVLTFQEAMNGEVLETILQKNLEKFYAGIKASSNKNFKNEDGSWKSFATIKNELRDLYFKDSYSKIQERVAELGDEWNPEMQQSLKEFCATHRFLPLMIQHKQLIVANPSDSNLWTTSNSDTIENTRNLIVSNSLAEQWKPIKSKEEVSRDNMKQLGYRQVFDMNPQEWSNIEISEDGNLSFFQLIDKQKSQESLVQMAEAGQKMLGDEAKRVFAKSIVQKMQAKGGIGLQYQMTKDESTLSSNPSEDSQ